MRKLAASTKEDSEIAEEEEFLYGARLSASPRVVAVEPGGDGRGETGLGSGPAERLIEAVGFKLTASFFRFFSGGESCAPIKHKIRTKRISGLCTVVDAHNDVNHSRFASCKAWPLSPRAE